MWVSGYQISCMHDEVCNEDCCLLRGSRLSFGHRAWRRCFRKEAVTPQELFEKFWGRGGCMLQNRKFTALSL